MTRAQLQNEILTQRHEVLGKYGKITAWIETDKLPEAAKGTYFYRTTQKALQKTRKNKSVMTKGLSKLKKSDLEKMLSKVKKLNEQTTSGYFGITNRLEEERKSADAVLFTSGFTSEEIEKMSDAEKSDFFKYAHTLEEMLQYPSDDAFAEALNNWKTDKEKRTFAQLYKDLK